MKFLSMLPSLNENSEQESNPMIAAILNLSASAFLVSFTDSNN